MTDYEQWLDSLKEDDKVVIDYTHHGKSIMRVVRRLKTKIVAQNTGNPVEFNAKTGKMIGATRWDTTYLIPWTAEIEAEIRLKNLQWKLKTDLQEIVTEKLTIQQCRDLAFFLYKNGYLLKADNK